MHDLTDHWVWDFWLARDGEHHHLFHLQAPRTLVDPERRHRHAGVGHAVSDDLVSWRSLPDVLAPAAAPAYDDMAVWTGSVVRGDDGLWRMFTSGLSRAEDGRVQRIGLSTSPDLRTWTRRPGPAYPLEADPRWYATGPGEVHWRDPWLVRDDAGTWHMYLTAQARAVAAGTVTGPGVVGHAVSADLESWKMVAPLSAPTGRFDQLEVIQVVDVEGRWHCVFSCLAGEMPGAPEGSGGIWAVEVEGPGSSVDVAAAYRLTGEEWYVGKLVRHRDGGWALLAFRNRDDHGRFVGGVGDPMPVDTDGERLVLKGFSSTLPPKPDCG